jgi:hypothetical protein
MVERTSGGCNKSWPHERHRRINVARPSPYLLLAGGLIAVVVGYFGQFRGFLVLGAVVVVLGQL